ncbi:elongator complex protein 6-like isoform X2 [Salvelinus namaycush]|uniref:Elongator complex protein 6 n=1 Tax=Salvelinus namaycush TaxID=8040 RepID=A0A8U0UEC9_SALNM|nr:elongator complex protein 6-like isoform X2 [Salvelinus namaycush]
MRSRHPFSRCLQSSTVFSILVPTTSRRESLSWCLTNRQTRPSSFTISSPFIYEGVSLAQAREKGQLVFIEGLKESLGVLLQGESSKGTRAVDFLRDPSSGLQGLYDFVRDNVRLAVGGSGEEWGPPVLLVDDLSVVLSLGVSVGAALDFSHYCRATVCSELQGSMVMLVRCEAEEEESDDERSEWLLRGLIHQCSLTLQVQGLPTGYCRDIHGQVEARTM